MFTKLSNENLMFALLPEDSHTFEVKENPSAHKPYIHHVRKIELTLDDLELMISKAREVGNKEKEGVLNNPSYLKSLGLIPLIKYQYFVAYGEEQQDKYVEKWIGMHF